MQVIECMGQDLLPYVEQVAKLRLKVFHAYPYLYDGSLAEEYGYLKTYMQAAQSYTVLLKNEKEYMGISTAIPMQDAKAHFSKPFVDHGYNLKNMVYFGESVLLPQYRGQGLGHLFFEYREAYAQRVLDQISYTTFCAVDRREDHPMRPNDYQDHSVFWNNKGYKKQPHLKTQLTWKDRDQSHATGKSLTYWVKAW